MFAAGEQEFFADKGFKNDPKHCKHCKMQNKHKTNKSRNATRTTCAECGIETTVPFIPSQGKPVLCRSCFKKKTEQMKAGVVQLEIVVANKDSTASTPTTPGTTVQSGASKR